MNAELKKKWIEALRSGEYKQAKNWLKKQDSFCCIGVGAKACLPDFEFRADGLGTFIAAEALGISEWEANHLVSLNDSRGKSFAEIANYIEANIPADEHSHTE